MAFPNFSLDFRSGAPIYAQIVEQVRAQIAAGKLKPGDQLPTVRQLALDLTVNFNTIARAYRLLDESGLISTQQGRGTYILGATEAQREKLRSATLEQLAQDFWTETTGLGYSPEQILAAVETARLANEIRK